MNKIRIGTRGSKLALRQAALVEEALRQAKEDIETEMVIIHTQGDKILDRPLTEIGEKGVFVSEFEQALLKGQIDMAVHSAKDLPMETAHGLTIAAVLQRGDVRDALVIAKGGRLPRPAQPYFEKSGSGLYDSVVEGRQDTGEIFVIGTGSRRRQRQAQQVWEHVVCESIRGNVDTRLGKLKAGGREASVRKKCGEAECKDTVYDGIILAKAGLDRLDIMSRYAEEYECYPLSPERFLPAACQGIIAVETVADSQTAALCRRINDVATELYFLVEREVLIRLAADCSETAAAWCRQEQDRLLLDVMYGESRAGLAAKVQSTEEWEERLSAGLKLARKAAELVKEQNRL